MNRKSYGSILAAALVCLSMGLWTGCSNSNTPPTKTITIAATSGGSQSATVSTAFAAPLVATVTTNGTPTSGVSVTFTAPGSGASGTFGNGTATETDTTNASGVATSSTFTANATAGGPYTVTASTTGATAAANFSLTNTAGAPATITATAGTPQSASVGTAFATNLAATVVDVDSNPVSGVVVTFTAPATGASGVFSDSTNNVTTATTGSNGVATAAAFTANTTVGGPYNVVATAGALAPANFALTNTNVVVSSANYVFSLSGQEAINNVGGVVNYYAVTGVVTIDANGNVLGGEQDYNDAFGITSPQPSGDTISAAASALVVDPTTGQGTLTLTTNNATLGVGGVETFGVQFVNASHALIVQFDGSATSSGSLDLQTMATSAGGYAFTFSGVDPGYAPVAAGGVFSISGLAISNGKLDVNDNGAVTTGSSFSGAITLADPMGRGTLSGVGKIAFNYYLVGPGVIRIIDVDTGDAGVGSAFGQSTNGTAGSNASLGTSVMAIANNPYAGKYGTLAQFSVSNTGNATADFAGVGDDNELDNGVLSTLASPISGTYSIGSNGYGSLTVTNAGLGSVTALGIYLTDPALNLIDPNNTSGGGGALVLDLDAVLAGGTGVIVPQTDNSAASFTGNYTAGWQDFNYYSNCGDCEFDMASQGTMTAGVLSLTGLDSDPFGTLTGTPALSTGDTFGSTPQADTVNTGRYTMLSTNTTANPLNATINGAVGSFDVVMYQASGGQLFWLNYDTFFLSVFTGPVEQQGSLTGMPAVRKPVAKTRKKH